MHQGIAKERGNRNSHKSLKNTVIMCSCFVVAFFFFSIEKAVQFFEVKDISSGCFHYAKANSSALKHVKVLLKYCNSVSAFRSRTHSEINTWQKHRPAICASKILIQKCVENLPSYVSYHKAYYSLQIWQHSFVQRFYYSWTWFGFP